MNSKQNVKMVLNAIYDAKRRATEAHAKGDTIGQHQIMGDLNALYICLVGDVQTLVDDLDKMRPYIIKGGKA